MERLAHKLTGQITVSSVHDSEKTIDQDIAKINGLGIPKKLTSNDVHIRECWLTGDAVNCYFGRFRTEDLTLMGSMVDGAPLLDSHDRMSLPMGRFFGATIQTKPTKLLDGKTEDVNYLVVKFYWMKDVVNSDDLLNNIDGGIWNEASISWIFNKPTCSVCDKDIRMCNHIPGEESKDGICFFWYDGILDVLEGSIVYAGGHPGTQFLSSVEQAKLKDGIIDCDSIKKKILTLNYNGKSKKIGMPNVELER